MALRSYPLLVFGFHGCERAVAEKVLSGSEHLKPSRNDYDWIGSGIYFWENAPERAFKWAVDAKKKEPAVIGAVIQVGSCLNLMDTSSNGILRKTYEALKAHGSDFPSNKGKLHRLDTLVINSAIGYAGGIGISFDAVRAAFIEGAPVFEGSEIMSDTHIQLCVRNPSCILSYFRPMHDGGNL